MLLHITRASRQPRVIERLGREYCGRFRRRAAEWRRCEDYGVRGQVRTLPLKYQPGVGIVLICQQVRHEAREACCCRRWQRRRAGANTSAKRGEKTVGYGAVWYKVLLSCEVAA